MTRRCEPILPFVASPDIEAALPVAAEHVRAGGVLAYPTETVYGFGGVATAAGVDALVRTKGRAPGKPFLLLVCSRAMVTALGLELTGDAERLAMRYWPGPLTLVLPGGGAELNERLRGPEGGVAVRWTPHPGLGRLLETIGQPMTSTSANAPGQPPARSAAAIAGSWRAALDRGVLLLLDGGVLASSPASTMVDCTGRHPRVIRPGAIASATLRETVPDLIGDV